MMFAKTVCNKPGSYVQVVPLGLLATLQYNKDGLLEKVFVGLNSKDEEVSPAALKSIRNYVPGKISVTGGTTWVEGVFYTDNFSTAPGILPECCYSDYLKRMEEGSEEFTFYAGHVDSLAVVLSGVLATRNWLSICKFNLLPGTVVPVDFNEQTIEMMISHGTYSFKYPYISGFMNYSSDTYEYVGLGLRQCTVKSVSRFIDEYGYVKCNVKTDDEALVLNYSDVVTHHIQTASCVTYCADSFINVLESRKTDNKKRDSYSNKMTCPVCGKQYIIPNRGPVQCDSEDCASKIYLNVKKLLSDLGMETMSVEEYKDAVEKKELTCITDVFLLPKYADKKPEVSLSAAIKSGTPAEICADDSFFERFANSCSNSVETALYYIQHPIQIENDLNITSFQGRRFVQWISNPANVLTIQTIFVSVNIKQKSKRFEGAPIFRGKNFIITGKFKHGSYDDIVSILESYSGKVMNTMSDNLPDAVIVGAMKDGLDGNIIQKARFEGVPVFEEDDFFSWNGIDADLKANLL